MRINAYAKGIQLGKLNNFFGLMTFYRYKDSSIIIGSNITYRSSYNSNLIGINRPCIISTNAKHAKLTIGDNCGFSGTVIGAFFKIELHENVRCGANTLISDSDWHNDDMRAGKAAAVIIKKNVWIGEGVKVLKGVIIGEYSVIGAGSVVTKDIPSYVIAAGNPCKIIKTIEHDK